MAYEHKKIKDHFSLTKRKIKIHTQIILDKSM